MKWSQLSPYEQEHIKMSVRNIMNEYVNNVDDILFEGEIPCIVIRDVTIPPNLKVIVKKENLKNDSFDFLDKISDHLKTLCLNFGHQCLYLEKNSFVWAIGLMNTEEMLNELHKMQSQCIQFRLLREDERMTMLQTKIDCYEKVILNAYRFI